MPAQVCKCDTLVVVHFRMSRIDGKCTVICGNCLLIPPHFIKRDTFEDPTFGIFGSYRKQLFTCFESLPCPSKVSKGRCFIIPRICFCRIDADRLIVRSNGVVKPPKVIKSNPFKIMGFGQFRERFERFIKGDDCFSKPAKIVEFNTPA